MIQRKPIGEPVVYKGSTITVRHMGPDLLGYVDDVELSGFFLNAEAARAAGCRYVDEKLKEAEKQQAKGRAS